ncbi:MAG: asparagine synthase (glutamine-hydrolyzing) [Chitinophagaceae bacterium]|nr:asparagine synthase (glutamine-hydrolyzing) [Chitinophagaceae bacterium]
MCGIVGKISFNEQLCELPSLEDIKHRGPDGNGEWFNPEKTIYFGHTRLAILEPTPAGHQPMHSNGGRYTIVFNGEIYNHQKLRAYVPGFNWIGNSDTETLLELFKVKGLETLNLLKGMFAFALYDESDKSVLLVRDRLGIKPLWVKTSESDLSFCSEILALIDNTTGNLCDRALSEYIGFGHLPASGQVFKNVEALLPGSFMKISNDGKIIQEQWWPKNNFLNTGVKNKIKATSLVKKLVTTAIEEHLISDVGVGAFLSGGIDSSIVALVAGKVLGKNLQTFTVGFPQSGFDERLIARKVARLCGSEHFELEITENDCLSSVQQAVECLDVPSVDAINTFIVSKAVRQTGLKVALSGLGGDELFGGYPSFKSVPVIDKLSILPPAVQQLILNLLPVSAKEKLGGIEHLSPEEITISRRRFMSIKQLKENGLGNGLPSILNMPHGLDTMGKISWAEMQGYMGPMLLRDSDQMSMAVGLELRVPFLDHELVEEVLSLPQRYKKGIGVKPLLVKAFSDILPVEVYNRPKQGFALPMEDWIKGPLYDFTLQGLKAAVEFTGIKAPLLQLQKFEQGNQHWTRVWKWSVLGHWLLKQHSLSTNSCLAEV